MQRTARQAVFALAATLVLAAVPTDAAAQSFAISNGAGWRTTTGVSGSFQPYTLTAPAGMVLYGLAYAENRDAPCLIEAYWWRPSAPRATTQWKRSDGCDNGHRRIRINASDEVPRALRLVRVCNRGSNDRVKGIRVRGANVTASGAQPDPGVYAEHDRPNCNDNWSPRISQCPEGQAITRVRVETSPTGTYGARAAVGLSVFCSRVRLSS